MNSRLLAGTLLFAAAAFSQTGLSQERGEVIRAGNPPMPVYVTPYYDSEGLKIAVGELSEKLAAADAKTALKLSAELKKQRDQLRAEVMYVAAIRMYDLGHKDEAVYWFYTAQFRARVFGSILDKDKVGSLGDEAFELQQAYGAFNELAGMYINGYAFGELEKLEKTLAKVAEEAKTPPNYQKVYPKVAFAPEETWAEQNQKVSTGLTGLIDYIKANGDSIREQRKENGLEGKF